MGDEPGELLALLPSLELDVLTVFASLNFCSALERIRRTCACSSSRIEDICSSLRDSTRITFLMCST